MSASHWQICLRVASGASTEAGGRRHRWRGSLPSGVLHERRGRQRDRRSPHHEYGTHGISAVRRPCVMTWSTIDANAAGLPCPRAFRRPRAASRSSSQSSTCAGVRDGRVSTDEVGAATERAPVVDRGAAWRRQEPSTRQLQHDACRGRVGGDDEASTSATRALAGDVRRHGSAGRRRRPEASGIIAAASAATRRPRATIRASTTSRWSRCERLTRSERRGPRGPYRYGTMCGWIVPEVDEPPAGAW